MTLATLKNLKCPMKHCELFWFTIIPTLQEAIHKVRSRVGFGNKNGYSMVEYCCVVAILLSIMKP